MRASYKAPCFAKRWRTWKGTVVSTVAGMLTVTLLLSGCEPPAAKRAP